MKELQFNIFEQYNTILSLSLFSIILISIIIICLFVINTKIKELNDSIKHLELKIDEKNELVNRIINNFLNIISKP